MSQTTQYKTCKYLHKIRKAVRDTDKNKYQKKLDKYVQQGGVIDLPKTEIIQNLTSCQYKLNNLNKKLNKYNKKLTNLSGGKIDNSKKNYYSSKIKYYNCMGGSLAQELNRIKISLNNITRFQADDILKDFTELKNNPTDAIKIGNITVQEHDKKIDMNASKDKVEDIHKLLKDAINEYNKYFDELNDKITEVINKFNKLNNDNNERVKNLDKKYSGVGSSLVKKTSSEKVQKIYNSIELSMDNLQNDINTSKNNINDYRKTIVTSELNKIKTKLLSI